MLKRTATRCSINNRKNILTIELRLLYWREIFVAQFMRGEDWGHILLFILPWIRWIKQKITKLEYIWDCNCEFLRESEFFVVNLLNESRKFSCTLTLFVAVWRSLVGDLQHMVSYPIGGSAKLFFPLNFSGPVAVHLQMDNFVI